MDLDARYSGRFGVDKGQRLLVGRTVKHALRGPHPRRVRVARLRRKKMMVLVGCAHRHAMCSLQERQKCYGEIFVLAMTSAGTEQSVLTTAP